MSLFAANPADLMRHAVSDVKFCEWFATRGGGHHVVDDQPLFTREELIERFCMTDAEYLALHHRYWPTDKNRNSLSREAIAKLCQTMTLAEIRALGRDMSASDIQCGLRNRKITQERVWQYYVAYRHGLPPQHPDVIQLVKTRFQTPWVMDELDVLDWGVAA